MDTSAFLDVDSCKLANMDFNLTSLNKVQEYWFILLHKSFP